jgi:hypothetical protein
MARAVQRFKASWRGRRGGRKVDLWWREVELLPNEECSVIETPTHEHLPA